ncbi:hypothetical protein [Bacillus amyloliquefaciens]|nr:hypothetical protein [Bacillus amyloliquefaciens]
MKTIDIKKEILSADKWQRITVDYVNCPNVYDAEGYREPIWFCISEATSR